MYPARYDRMVPQNKNHCNSPTSISGGQSSVEKEERVFINESGDGTFICPYCSKGVIKDLSEFAQTRSAVRIRCKCSCGNVYRALLERRRHFRRIANLLGTYVFNGGADGRPAKGLIRVRDISQSGIQFTLNSVPVFDIGDQLTIEFTLDDEESSQICEVGVVRRVQSNVVGLEFKTTDHYGRLGQYLFR